MKTNLLSLFILMAFVGSFQSCVKDSCEKELTYQKATPIYMTYEEIRAEIKSTAPQVMENPGKLYFYNDYLFINENRKGIHVIDNSDPSNPQNVSFIEIPGNVDISVRNNMLYADNFTDLVTIDISDVLNVQFVKRLEDAFPVLHITEQLLLTHYEYEEVTEIVNCNNRNRDVIAIDESFNSQVSSPTGDFDGNSNIDGNLNGSDGQGGSFARFTLYDNYLYSVSESDLLIFDVSQDNSPSFVSSQNIGWGIETIFPYQDKLFIGSNSGMDIYDVSNPTMPTYVSGYSHWTGCDPVFVSGDYAYVTIHSGALCNGGTLNQLDILDISDIFNPILERSVEMENPHGLSVLDDHLYLCEGAFGLKVFDVTKPLELDQNQVAHLKDFNAYDVIGLSGNPNRLLLIGTDGFRQFDVSDPSNPAELSLISVQR